MKYKIKVIVDVMSTYVETEVEADSLEEAKDKAREAADAEVVLALKRTVEEQGYEVLVEELDD